MIDSHAHLNDPAFAEDLPAVVARAKDAGVRTIINVGYDLASSKKAVELAGLYPELWAVVGVHPHDAKTWTPVVKDEITKLCENQKVLALGEIGLDYYYDHSPREKQQEVFRKQLALARELKRSVVIHSREATQDTLEIIREYPDVACLLHCYSGSWETAQVYAELGHFFSFGGPITFQNANRLREVVRKIPLELVLLETDCPYLTPHPHRGKRNEPAYLTFTAEKLAAIHGREVGEIARITEENTRRFFSLLKEDLE